MRDKLHRSLSSRIVALTIFVFGIILLGLYLFFDTLSERALMASEKEKAQLIVHTVAPIMGVDLYLGVRQPLLTLADEIMKNRNVTALKLTEGNRTVIERSRNTADAAQGFEVEAPVIHPVTGRAFAVFSLHYSNAHYQKLNRQFRFAFLFITVVLAAIAVAFSFYLRRMLQPLRRIADALKQFRPDQPIDLPSAAQTDEIGQISRALKEMSERIHRYDEFQKNYKKHLQAEILKKTQQLQEQLRTNALTGLPNRYSLTRDIQQNGDGIYAVINIDRFGQVNDLFGQEEGDRILAEMGKLLHELVQNGILKTFRVYKLSADEFGIFSPDVQPDDIFRDTLDRLIEAVESHAFEIGGFPMNLRITVGAGIGQTNIMEKADIALNLARAKRLPYMIYEERFRAEETFHDNLRLLRLLQNALKEERLAVWVQPIVDNTSKSPVSYECLMRLIGDDGTVLTPDRFLEFSKKARFYPHLTRTMIRKAFRFFAGTDLHFSVNLSIEDIIDPATAAFIRREMLRYNVASQLTFELLESENIENYPEIAGFIKEVKSLGCRFAIDDFGSGYSNFEHLLHLEIDTLKIDGTLIRTVDTDENTRTVVETIVAFAKKRDLVCIAEFVHSEQVYETVRTLGISYSQGYYFSKPFPLEELANTPKEA